MNKCKALQTFTAIVLSIAMTVSMAPLTVVAETSGTDISTLSTLGEIIAFEKLTSEIMAQSVPLGTSEYELTLPEALTTVVRLAPEPDGTDADAVSGSAIDFSEGGSEITTSLPVTWVPSPAYDYEMADTYIFTPVLPEGYELSDGVMAPQITVTVGLSMRLALASTGADYSWYDTNKAAKTFVLESTSQLKGLADIVNGSHGAAFNFSGRTISLNADLDLSGYSNWTPIGSSAYPFAGSFEGNNHTLSNLTIDMSDTSNIGLFGMVMGNVSNLILNNVNITGRENVGGIAGEAWGTLSKCAVIGGTINGFKSTGGVVGKATYNPAVGHQEGYYWIFDGSSIDRCFSTCNINGVGESPNYAGGVVGSAEYSNITNCYATGSIKDPNVSSPLSDYFYGVGGVAGWVKSTSIINCYATGDIAGTQCIGGIVGAMSSYDGKQSVLKNCVALNSLITGYKGVYDPAGPQTGRIAGKFSNSLQSGNNAYSGMTVTASGALNGTSVTGDSLEGQDIFAPLGYSHPTWSGGIGMVPVLVGFPEGLQSTDIPSHINADTPSMPRNLSATIADGQVTLSWVSPTSSGTSSIIRYEVCKNSDEWISAEMLTSYTYTGLTNGTAYTFAVRAVNSSGDGRQATISKTPGKPPAAVQNAIAVMDGSRITLFWEKPSDTESDDSVYYDIRYSDSLSMDDRTKWDAVNYGSYSHSYSNSHPSAEYTIQIRAGNLYGIGPVTTVCGGYNTMYPSPVRNLTSTRGDGQVTLSWNPPQYQGHSAISSYAVFHPVSKTWISTGLATSYTVTGLTNGQTYRFFVRAVNGYSKIGSSATLEMDPRNPPDIYSEDHVSLPYGQSGSFQVQAHGIEPFAYSLNGAPSGVTIVNSGLMSINGDIPVGSYSFTVKAANGSLPDASQNFTLTITPYTPNMSDLNYTHPVNRVYNGTNTGIGAVTDKRGLGLSITVYYEGMDGTDYTKTTVPPKRVGKYKVTASIAGSTNIRAANFTLGLYDILPKGITVTPLSGQNKIYGQPDPDLKYTLSPSLESGDSLSGALTRVAGQNAGNYGISLGTLSGTGNYTLSLSGAVSFTIHAKNSATFTIAEIPPQTYTGLAFTPEPEVRDGSAILTKGVDFTYGYANTVNAGTIATVNITGKGNYAGSTGSKTFTINKAENSLGVSCTNITYGETPSPFAETNVSGGTVSYIYKIKGADDSTYTPTIPTAAGSYTVQGTSTATANYYPSTATSDFIIGKADHTLGISCANITYGEAPAPFAETNTSDGTMVYEYKVLGTDDSTYTPILPTAAGNYTVRGISEATANYNEAIATTNFTIGKADHSLDISCADITYGDAPSPLVETNISNGMVSYEYKILGADDSTYTPILPTAAGSYTLRGISESTANYNEAIATTNFNINKAIPPLMLVADPADTQTRPGNVALLAILPTDATGSLTYKVGTDTLTTVSLPNNTASFEPTDSANTYGFTVQYSGDSNYEGNTSPLLEFSFTKSDQAVLTVADGTISYGGMLDLSPLVSGGSGTGSVSFEITDGPGEIDGTVLSPTSVGDVTIAITKAADNNYNANSATLKVTVTPRVITFTVATVEAQAYTGITVTPTPEVKDGDIVLTVGEHFSYSYLNNTNAGTSATINITGINNYEGSTSSVEFKINPPIYSDDNNSRRSVILPAALPNQPTVATVIVTAEVVNRYASLTITDRIVEEAIDKALADAKATGNTANGISVDISVTAKGATGFALNLNQSTLNQLLDAGVNSFRVSSLPVNMSLDAEALKQILKQSGGNIAITVKPTTVSGLRNAYEIIISSTKSRKTVNITSLGAGNSTLSISVDPRQDELVGFLYGTYVDANKKINRIADSAYDANSKRIIFTTNHFSVYGVGYTVPSTKFTDITTHWAKEAIDYVVGRGLLTGTTLTNFAPNSAMTRAVLVTALGKLADVNTKLYNGSNFTDMGSNTSIRPYADWAIKEGIILSTGNRKFEPDRAITREEIAVIFENYAKATGFTLPVTREVAPYADTSSIDNIHKAAVTRMQQAGIMMSRTSNKFSPKANITRAEVSSMLHRYIMLTIDPGTAQGWAKNDDGQYLYYKDGKALNETQIIDGTKYFFNTDGTLKTGWVKDNDNKTYYFTKDGIMVSGKWFKISRKWYYFYDDGTLARSTKVDQYEVDENGVRKSS